ncbi:YsnF/AvaK domain-containing protein [Peribacillus sp. SCS-155]|uniref:YsnF/AvaK domain-containing protein n=1 Tax=Peribacillus sedimenti TaxID=3115297 RepID=UPI003906AAD3
MDKHVYGVYDSGSKAIIAIQELKSKGYDGNDITLVADREERFDFGDFTTLNVDTITAEHDNDETFMDKVARFFSVDSGSVDLHDTLSTAGLPSTEADRYVADVEQGKILVLVDEDTSDLLDGNSNIANGTSGEYNSVNATLGESNSVDATMGDRNTVIDGNSTDSIYSIGNQPAHLDDERKLRLREEQLEINKERVQAGEVVINKEVKEEQKTVNVPVEHEEVYVEHHSVRDTDALDAGPIGEDETIRIPLTEEKINVNKRAVVTDEIVIGKQTVTETQQVSDTLRKEDIDVEETDNRILRDQDNRLDR